MVNLKNLKKVIMLVSLKSWVLNWVFNFKKPNLIKSEESEKLEKLTGIYYIFKHRQKHFFHIVSPSSLPFMVSSYIYFTVVWFVEYLMFIPESGTRVLWSLFIAIFLIFIWFIIIIWESKRYHTLNVEILILDGFILFIFSEIMFFFSFFWAFFSSSISPTIWIYSSWPPLGIETIYAFDLPLLNTALLLFSGWTVTWAHKSLIENSKFDAIQALFFTLLLSILFTSVQFIEYKYACFSIYDGIYASCFFLLTGFHGFHVILGTIMLFVCFIRIWLNQLSTNNFNGFEVSIWYWHFVDVVWVFLFIFVYWWGNIAIDPYYLYLSTINRV